MSLEGGTERVIVVQVQVDHRAELRGDAGTDDAEVTAQFGTGDGEVVAPAGEGGAEGLIVIHELVDPTAAELGNDRAEVALGEFGSDAAPGRHPQRVDVVLVDHQVERSGSALGEGVALEG